MASKALDLLKAAHSASLLGYEIPMREESIGSYVQLGDDKVPYDLRDPQALNELKIALFKLGQYHASLTGSQQSVEKRWRYIVQDYENPGWDAGAADEFAMAIGRYRGWGWQVSEPYSVIGPNGPTPTATGLELIAGACRTLLKDFQMSVYEAWRGGMIPPPSSVSGPSPKDPVTPPNYFGAGYKVVPAGSPEWITTQISAIDGLLQADWAVASNTSDEASLGRIGLLLETHRGQRDFLVNLAIAYSQPRQGTTEVVRVDQDACAKVGGTWDTARGYCEAPKSTGVPNWVWLLAIPAGAAGVYWYRTKHKGGSSSYGRLATARANRRRRRR